MIRTWRYLFTIKTLGILLLALLLVPALVEAAKGGGGKGKGGFGEGATGCSLFRDDSVGTDVDEIQSDHIIPSDRTDSVYCHGTDGQVSLATRYRHDLKKFNSNDREVSVNPRCWGGESLKPGGALGDFCLGSSADGYIWQSYEFLISARGPWTGLSAMTEGQRAEMSLGIQIGKQGHVVFGGQGLTSEPSECNACPPGDASDKVWVKCIGGGITGSAATPCTRWTITTDYLGVGEGAPSRACMIHYKGGTQCIDSDVEADFEIEVWAE